MIASILLLLIVSCENIGQNKTSVINIKPIPSKWDFVKTDGSNLIFQDGRFINTKLFEINYLETLFDSMGNPYFIISGRTCKNCDENIAIFLISPNDTSKIVLEQNKYTYPGKEYDYETNQLNFETRLFICNCIHKKNSSLIWIQIQRSKNNLDSSIFIVDVFCNKIKERIIKPHTKDYYNYLLQIKHCKEIVGIESTSEP